jgi:uncharacterized repeat protein (TIGR03803 family)
MFTVTRIIKGPALLALAVCLATTATVYAQSGFEVVHTFSGNQGRPLGGLTEGSDGKLYGTTISGGFFGRGSVYVTDAAGNAATIHEFDGTNGQAPRGRLLLGADGALYGTTSLGGVNNLGTVFRINADGSFQLLVEFDGLNGGNPQGGLVQASNGDFYGTTLAGGVTASGEPANGTIFRINAAGQLTTLVSFNDANGAFPAGSLIQAGDGYLYGTTRRGGAAGLGTVFQVNPETGALATMVNFDGTNGAMPNDGPMQASNGDFYGTTQRGGTGACAPTPEDAGGCGTIFRLSGGVLTTLHSFAVADGKLPVGPLHQLADGNIYGTTPEGGANNAGTIFRISTAGAFASLLSFNGVTGSLPGSGVIQTTSGAIFGTTESGGAGTYGTVFELMPGGSLREVVSFAGSAGSGPSSQLLQASDGNFYGTTITGGAGAFGSVFRMTPGGIITTLASFNGENGMFPSGGLVQSIDGNLYGTAESGGAGDGTLFRVSLNGELEAFSFDLGVNGSLPLGRLIEGHDGYIYGTLALGQASFDEDGIPLAGAGAVFRFDRASETIQAFQLSEAEGAWPSAGVTEGPDGYFYGTAEMGGDSFSGTIFRMSQSGEFSALASFDGLTTFTPASPLTIGRDGKLYGTTSGDFFGLGSSLFRVALDGTLETLVILDGAPYEQGVVEVSDGVFYGTTSTGGANFAGNIFRWSESHGLETIHDFDDVEGSFPNTSLMKASDNRLYGTASGPQGGVIYRIEVVTDTTPPVLQLPANMVVNATSPSGAIVVYEATATDDSGLPVTVVCTPASGSIFAIGTKTVTCTATDAAGNTARGSFTVKVLSAAEQLVNLLEKIRRMPLSPTIRTLLISTLNTALADPKKTQLVLDVLKLLTAVIKLRCPADVAASLITDINRIRAVIGG